MQKTMNCQAILRKKNSWRSQTLSEATVGVLPHTQKIRI